MSVKEAPGDYFSETKPSRNMDTVRGLCPCFKQPSSEEQYEYIGESLQWRHNERDGVLTHRRLDCLLNRLFRHR